MLQRRAEHRPNGLNAKSAFAFHGRAQGFSLIGTGFSEQGTSGRQHEQVE
jgi:hypothetical protein